MTASLFFPFCPGVWVHGSFPPFLSSLRTKVSYTPRFRHISYAFSLPWTARLYLDQLQFRRVFFLPSFCDQNKGGERKRGGKKLKTELLNETRKKKNNHKLNKIVLFNFSAKKRRRRGREESRLSRESNRYPDKMCDSISTIITIMYIIIIYNMCLCVCIWMETISVNKSKIENENGRKIK